MTPERLAAIEAAAAGQENEGIMRVVDPRPARLDEAQSPVAGRRFTRALLGIVSPRPQLAGDAAGPANRDKSAVELRVCRAMHD